MPKRNKYSNEVEKLKMLKSINSVLKKGDIENALLSNSARDNEIVSDTVIEGMLDNLNSGKGADRDMEVVEKLTTYNNRATIIKRKRTRVERSNGRTRVRRSIRIVKKRREAGGRKTAKPRRKRR